MSAPAIETRVCRGCGSCKPLNEFYAKAGRVWFRCLDCHRAKIREWHASHKRRVDEIKKAFRERNRSEENARARERYWANRDEARERINNYQKRWRREHPERHRAYLSKRRKQLSCSGSPYTESDVIRLQAKQKWRCAEPACRKSLRDGYHVDHIMPLALGGTNGPENIQLLCATCNHRKGSRHPIEWAQMNGRLF